MTDFGIFRDDLDATLEAKVFAGQAIECFTAPQTLGTSPHSITQYSCSSLIPFFSNRQLRFFIKSSSIMISEQKIRYDELRASEEALLANDECQISLPLASYSKKCRIIEGIFKAFDGAHLKMLCWLALVQVLLIIVYTIVFLALRSNIAQIDQTALISCE